MKKTTKLLSLALLAATTTSYAQTWTSSGTNILTSSGTTNVGIGTTSPSDKLTVNGDVSIQNSSNVEHNLFGRSSTGWLNIAGNTNSTDGAMLRLYGKQASGTPGMMQLVANGSTGTGFLFSNFDPTNSSWSNPMTITNQGKIGIGFAPSTSTQAVLTVKGNNSTSNSYIDLLNTSDIDWSAQIRFGLAGGQIQHIITNRTTNNGGTLTIIPGWGGGSTMMDINGGINISDKAIIGTVASTPAGYRLYVQNGILTEKVRVAVNGSGNWADHVFADNYNLKSLTEVESYIKTNKHLPEIPSVNDVVKDGVDLGAMDAKLLQKVEELTLYVIQQQKEIETLKKQIKNN